MTDSEIVKAIEQSNEEYRKLNEEHRSLKDKLLELEKRAYLSPEDEMEKKTMKKKKLIKKDRMAQIVKEYKSNISMN